MLNDKYYALKIIPKYKLDTKGRLNSNINEPKILMRLKNSSNFVPEIVSAFQDYENIYLVYSIFDGPTLYEFRNENLTEEQIIFILACIIESLKDIRQAQIIHRDLKLQNVVMDKDNYFNLIDFSFSVLYSNRNSKLLKCNLDKLNNAPEILSDSEYDYNSDYFRLGYLLFFFIFKKNPWQVKQGKNLTELIEMYSLKGKYSLNLFDFLNGLMETNFKKRLGYKNIDQLMNHPLFNGLDWKKFEKKQITSPFYYNKTKVKRPICKRFIKTKDMIQRYEKFIQNEYYIKSIKKFEFA